MRALYGPGRPVAAISAGGFHACQLVARGVMLGAHGSPTWGRHECPMRLRRWRRGRSRFFARSSWRRFQLRSHRSWCRVLLGINFSSELGTGTPSAGNQYASAGLRRHHVHAARRRWRPATCGLTSDGAAFCWGGSPAQVPRPTHPFPTAVGGGMRFSFLAAGGGFTCGLTPAGPPTAGGQLLGRARQWHDDEQSHAATSGRRVELCGHRAGRGAMPVRPQPRRGVCWVATRQESSGPDRTVEVSFPCWVAGGLAFRAIGQAPCFVAASRCPERRIVGAHQEGRLGTGSMTPSNVPVGRHRRTDVHGVVRREWTTRAA